MKAKQDYKSLNSQIDYFADSFRGIANLHHLAGILASDECIDRENVYPLQDNTEEFWDQMIVVGKSRFLMNCEEYGIKPPKFLED